MLPDKFILSIGKEIKKTAALVSRCNLFISNDTGLMHVAAAVKVSVIAIFGPTDPVKSMPFFRHIIIKKDLQCRPCYRYRPIACRHRRCLEEITPEEVLDKIFASGLLSRKFKPTASKVSVKF